MASCHSFPSYVCHVYCKSVTLGSLCRQDYGCSSCVYANSQGLCKTDNGYKTARKLPRKSVNILSKSRLCFLSKRLDSVTLLSTHNVQDMTSLVGCLQKYTHFHVATHATNADITSTSLDSTNSTNSQQAKSLENDTVPIPDEGKAMTGLKGIFPGGLRRAEVRIPGLVLVVNVSDVLGPEAGKFLSMLDSAVAGGFTMLVLQLGESGDQGGNGGARLYEAARILKSALRGRAELLIAERVDIASAAEASGVLLSNEGLPTVVARSMMQNVIQERSVMPLVARSVTSAESALLATASEGADLLMLQNPEGDPKLMVGSICERVSIPVFSEESVETLSLILKGEKVVFPSLEAGATGITCNSSDLKNISADSVGVLASSLVSAMEKTMEPRSYSGLIPPPSEVQITSITEGEDNLTSSRISSLDFQMKKILDEERDLLKSLICLIQEATPEMEDVSLLKDAVVQLDEPFLLMVVGEFNSGKSSVINALLGKRYLAEGVLPTTNEIALLKHAGDGSKEKQRSERHPDGHFMYFLPSELLKEINLVDTPGTNVILKRQQRLTEEFVPRADLVLFVLSADRPFTESELAFLQYIRQWDKKIIFLLNKSDIYLDRKELDDVKKFVRDNAQQVLNVEQIKIYAVSARWAFQAKGEAIGEDGTLNADKLLQTSMWNLSGFQELENFIADFLGGQSDAGAERRRLKLTTPLGIALALLEACSRQLMVEAKRADSDLEVLNELKRQLNNYEEAMESEALKQCHRLLDLVEGAKIRAERFVDSVLRISNVDAVARYLLGGDRGGTMPVAATFDDQVLGSVLDDMKVVLQENSSMLEKGLARQLSDYKELLRSRWPTVKPMLDREFQEIVKRNSYTYIQSTKPQETIAIRTLESFDIQAAKIVLEQELRDVIFTSFGGLGAAGVSASVLTSILPNTLEDLLALAFCSAAGYAGIWNLPNKRNEVKTKIQKVVDSFTSQMEAAMQTETKNAICQLRTEIGELMQPYVEAAEAEANRVRNLQDRVAKGNSHLENLRLRVQNLGN